MSLKREFPAEVGFGSTSYFWKATFIHSLNQNSHIKLGTLQLGFRAPPIGLAPVTFLKILLPIGLS